MKLVVIESPLRGEVPAWCPRWLAGTVESIRRELNKAYAARCMQDALRRGEAPYASHLLFDRPGVLNDAVPAERELGIRAGLAWGERAELRAVYCDHGITEGMARGIAARPKGQQVVFRMLDGKIEDFEVARAFGERQDT